MSEPHQPVPRLPPLLLVLAGAVAVVGSNSLLLSPILADVARSLHATSVTVSYAAVAYGGATAASALLFGPQVDRFGPRRALLTGLAFLLAATLASAAAGHWAVLAGAQAVAGVGAGLVLPAAYGLAIAHAPPGLASRALGRTLVGWSVSLVAGVPAASFLAQQAGWRAPFIVLAGLAAAALAGAARFRGDAPPPAGARPDVLAPLAFPGVPALLAVCVAFMAAFYGVYAFVGDAARSALGLSAARAGLIVLSYGLGFGGASLGDGLLDRIGPRRLFPWLLAALAAVYGLIPAALPSFPRILALAGCWGLLNHFCLNTLVLLLGQARPAARSAVLGLNSAVTYLAAMLGVAAAGAIGTRFGFDAICYAAGGIVVCAAVVAPRRVQPGG